MGRRRGTEFPIKRVARLDGVRGGGGSVDMEVRLKFYLSSRCDCPVGVQLLLARSGRLLILTQVITWWYE